MESVAITGAVRQELGKKSSKAVRRNQHVPCVIYGGEKVLHFSAHKNDFKTLIYTPDFKIAKISVDDGNFDCIVKDIQFHPLTDEIEHIDFVQLVPEKKIKLEIPVRFKGQAPGVKEGGKMVQKMRRVKVKTTLESLVDSLYVDVSGMGLGQSVRVRDIEVSGDMEIMSSMGTPVASIEIPRALRSAEAAKAAEEN
ncbi:MAG: 50S ribosomal protein L25/general stress protein Ctc [Bacteroidota bacterium]